MAYQPNNPLMIQSDMSVLFEVDHPDATTIRHVLSDFAELEKSPEHVHTYRITPLSLWNAAASGRTLEQILDLFEQYSKFDIAPNVIQEIRDQFDRFGLLTLTREGDRLILVSQDPSILRKVFRFKSMKPYVAEWIDEVHVAVTASNRGRLKQDLIKIGYPVQDLAGYTEGSPLPFQLRESCLSGEPFALRTYQTVAVDSFYAGGSSRGGSGVLVLPCGAGKTVIGIAAAAKIGAETLILTSSVTAARQWIAEILDKTTVREDQIGEYSGAQKVIRPITVATYQIVSRNSGKAVQDHLNLFNERNWGLIIYDEVHLLPAPVFRVTADIQARRRLGLTATLIREDGLESDVFTLIGPKKYDVPWKELERSGWIATADCREIRVALEEQEQINYAAANARTQARLAAEANGKNTVVKRLLQKHCEDQVLIIGQYLSQLKKLQQQIQAPMITGQTSMKNRDELYHKFRTGAIHCLIVSKVANFAIDLPDANVAIQISGQFGSRQEEAQRLGRILRPKKQENQAYFYSLVAKNTKEQEFAMNRQRFLTEQGYAYRITEALPAESDQVTKEVNASIASLDAYRQKKRKLEE
ncbi:DNA repair helicase XPB [Sporolactobacillus inulinus]|uniref:DNA repair helicase XPB n=1 Tax=Sporolactobacillus inulinus TaxID=2078 RepID=UPI00116D31DD|nr:DNA repair helicase XPB [Sporolactobacillus inulinus]GEB76334.1 DEAD/DEAH box helicase [Sporolactobacillus inulinus]